MAVSSDTLRSAEEKDTKGKAVYVLHTWKDALWEMGPSKGTDPPAPRVVSSTADDSDGSLEYAEEATPKASPAAEEAGPQPTA